MNIRPPDTRYPILKARAILTVSALAVLLVGFSANALAQRTITKKYPEQRNVRFEM